MAATPLSHDLLSQLQGTPISQLGQQLGLSPDQASAAVATALPLLLGALGRNAGQPQGASALFDALRDDHAGREPTDVLGSLLGGADPGQGASILGHVFGPRRDAASQQLGTATGLGEQRASQLLKLLAPLVLAYLAKRMFQGRQTATPTGARDTTAPSPARLGAVLGEERHGILQQGGPAGRLLGSLFDRDGDGDVDLADFGQSRGTMGGTGPQPRV